MHRRACMAAFITPSSVSYDGVPPKLVYTCEEANLEESVLQKFVKYVGTRKQPRISNGIVVEKKAFGAPQWRTLQIIFSPERIRTRL